MNNRDKAIDRATKLRAQMQSEAQLGNEDAALAFAAAMQRLLLEHELSDAELDAHQESTSKAPEEPIIEREVSLPALGEERGYRRNGALEHLAGIIGRAHLCKILVRSRSNVIWFVGTERHIEVSEYMLRVLWRGLHRMAKQGLRAAKRDGENCEGYTPAFKLAFLQRLNVRYAEERQIVEAEAKAEERIRLQLTDGQELPAESTALVRLTAAIERIDTYVRSKYRTNIRGASAGRYSNNSRGRADGTAAANRIGLRANGIGSASSTRQLNA